MSSPIGHMLACLVVRLERTDPEYDIVSPGCSASGLHLDVPVPAPSSVFSKPVDIVARLPDTCPASYTVAPGCSASGLHLDVPAPASALELPVLADDFPRPVDTSLEPGRAS